MFNNTFLSFLSAAASGGSIDVNLQSFNASANVNVTLSATGFTAGMAPELLAISAISQYNTQITQLGLQFAIPQITGEIPSALFRLSRTEHIINFFSECQFNLTLTSNDTGSEIRASHEPILATLDSFTEMSSLINGASTLSTSAKIMLLEVASGMIISYTHNLFAIAGYVQSFNGFYQRSFFLNLGAPIQLFDPPRIAPPVMGFYNYWYLWFVVFPWLRWNLNPLTGELFFQPNQNLLCVPEPGSLNYQVKISYTAGEFKLPSELLLVITQIAKAVINDPLGVKSLKTGSFSVAWKDRGALPTALALLDSYVI